MIRLRPTLAVVLAAAALNACSLHWPGYNGGGAAEWNPPAPNYRTADAQAYAPYRIEMSRLEQLYADGAVEQLPGHVVMAERQANRIARELAAGLTSDAFRDLIEMRSMLDRMEHLLAQAIPERGRET